ncbi:hypothetical protein NMY22_g4984 [Coprinellus aureogranulatus]|nr:hypothetical protein NMY22_g4984 [Coprinellus aureogranulatus]
MNLGRVLLPFYSPFIPDEASLLDEERTNEEYIFSFAPKDRLPLFKCFKNPKTSRFTEIEELDSLEELGYNVYELKEASAMYTEVLDSTRACSFLKTPRSGYDLRNGTWSALPSHPGTESELREPLVGLLNTIAGYVYLVLPGGTTREAVDSHDIPLAHDNGTHFTSPGICIKAAGPSFEVPEHAGRSRGLGYSNVASVLDVKLDKTKGNRVIHSKRAATFNRQIFIQQPNRHFSRSLLVTEKVFRLIHFDRSGVYVTKLSDIHKDASLFVQFAAGLMSPDERVLGLDTSVQWTIDQTLCRKVAGTITLSDTSGSETYELDMNEPPFVRPGIRGRGTVGWPARDPTTGEAVLVKDSWHTDSRHSECEFLLKAKGIPGIVEILDHEDYCAETAQYRPTGFDNEEFRNRFKPRLVLKRYGEPIWFFRSRLRLLLALRDVLVGTSRELFERGIIHRDISMLNILLGAPDSREGNRADPQMVHTHFHWMAFITESKAQGTRRYQSISVLKAPSLKPFPPQDYHDDLESLFYVYCHLVFGFEQPGVKNKEESDLLGDWDSGDVHVVSTAKTAFTLCPTNLACIPDYWGEACTTLLEEFQEVIRDVVRQKQRVNVNRRLDAEGKLKAYDATARDLDIAFGKVKDAFEKAITALEKEGLNAQELEPYLVFTPAPHANSSGNAPSSHREFSTAPVLQARDPVTHPNNEIPLTMKKRRGILEADD